MKSSLLAELKQLKSCKPEIEPPRNKGRMERVMQFEEANGISLSDSTPQQQRKQKRQGLFKGITFCFPLIDPPNDPPPQKLVQLAKGIYSQGGRLIEFSTQLAYRQVKYVLIDDRSDVGVVREVLRQRVLYVAILNYRWVEVCLRRLARVQIASYNLESNYVATEASRAQARKRQEEEVNNARKRPFNQFMSNTVDKKHINNNTQPVRLHNISQGETEVKEGDDHVNSDSDTVVMDEPEDKEQVEIGAQVKNKNQNEKDEKNNQNFTVQVKLETNQQQNLQSIHGEKHSQLKHTLSNVLSEVKQQQIIQPKLQENDQDSPSQFQTQSKAFQWSQSAPPSDNESQATEKMDSDNETPPQSRSLPAKTISKGEEMSELPQVTRRKTKLALGSHQFPTNNLICQKLKQMQQIYVDTGNRKQYAYLRAIAAIRNYGKEIKTADQLKNIEGLGHKTIAKIRQFLQTGCIAKVERQLNAKDAVPFKELLRVHGIGLKTAEELAHKGIRTLADLQANQELLNRNQRMGLKYVDDFEQRIPREKVAKMFEFVRQTLYYVARSDAHHDVEAVGSFRRGKATCGDIDILVTRRDGGVDKGLMNLLVGELERRGFITDHITQPRPFDGRHAVHYMGVCRLDGGPHHRIDLKLYPADQYAFALLYFTGSDLFNREMRMAASQRGLVLGDHGVRRQERNVGKPWRNNKIPVCFTEKDVFQLLGMQYRPPNQRQL